MGSAAHNPDRVSFGSEPPPRGSTSQMCLHKILRTIASVKPPPLPTAATSPFSGTEIEESYAENDAKDGNKGSGFDVNVVRRCVPSQSLEVDDASGPSSTCTAAGDFKETSGGRFGKEEFKIEEAGKSLALLIEAAKLIFGEFKDSDNSEPESGIAVKKDDVAAEMRCEFDEPPVVRSKRGRTQVLPYKYRDSVLEPLTGWSRNRSSSFLPNKRTRR